MSGEPGKKGEAMPEAGSRGCALIGLALGALIVIVAVGGGLTLLRRMEAEERAMQEARLAEERAFMLARTRLEEARAVALADKAARRAAFEKELAAALSEPRFPGAVLDDPVSGDMVVIAWVRPEGDGLAIEVGQLRLLVEGLAAPKRFWFRFLIRRRSEGSPEVKVGLEPGQDIFETRPKENGFSCRLLGLQWDIVDASLAIGGRTFPLVDTPPIYVSLDASGQVLEVFDSGEKPGPR